MLASIDLVACAQFNIGTQIYPESGIKFTYDEDT